MDTNLSDLTDPQRQALIDLLILTMYADGHLTLIEDAEVEKVLVAMGYDTEFDRQKQLDASMTRIRQHAKTPELARVHATTLAQNFTAREHRLKIYSILEFLITSDGHITTAENQLLETIRQMFKL
jgi:uncharacterized tellurite resistance protein B-like protein